MFMNYFKLNIFLTIRTDKGYDIADVTIPKPTKIAPRQQYCNAYFDVEYSVKLIFYIFITLSLVSSLDKYYHQLLYHSDFQSEQTDFLSPNPYQKPTLLILSIFYYKLQVMFCCTRQSNHQGQIVNALCTEIQCIRNNNQLACVLCLQEQHSGHKINSLKNVVPKLLDANKQKQESRQRLSQLLQFVSQQFGKDNLEGTKTTQGNIVQRVMQLLSSLKKQSQTNAEELAKMRVILKNLNKNYQQPIYKNSSLSPSRQSGSIIEEQSEYNHTNKGRNNNYSPSLISSPSVVSKSNPSGIKGKNMQSVMANFQHNIVDLQFFSQTTKHPYLSLSSDLRSVFKVSHSGHRYAAVGAKILSQHENQIRLRIDKSISGNIMVGFCHEKIVKQKQFSNCYGIGNGTYLIGQNGNNPSTAISFHHSLTMMNRKQIVGWNFQQGDDIVLGVNFQEDLIYFRRQNKKNILDFSMALSPAEIKAAHQKLLEQGFKLIVLLQAQGDQVSIIPH